MRLLLTYLTTLLLSLNSNDNIQFQQTDYVSEIQDWQTKMNSEFNNPEESPLTKEGLNVFEGLDFYNIDSKFRVESELEKTPFEPVFGMPTTTTRLPEYKKYGIATFHIDGKEFKLNVYQNQKLINMKGYEDYLFVPYIDLTSGKKSYSGGRYIDLRIPEGNVLIIDFNKSYNPYCAYNHKYSCPIPPVENTLNTSIEAGVMEYKDLPNKSHK